MQHDLIAFFASDLIEKAQAEINDATKRFAKDPRGFATWAANHLREVRERMTVSAFLAWASQNEARLSQTIEQQASANIRDLDRRLLEARTQIDRAHNEEEAKKRPPEPDTQRRPPSREELLSAEYMSRDNSASTTFGAVSGRATRRSLQRGRV